MPLITAVNAQEGVSIVMNGSFEYDGLVSQDITVQPPKYWEDVNVPDNFTGAVTAEWSTHRERCLRFKSGFFTNFNAGDRASVSQQVYLYDVNLIMIDTQLTTSFEQWDSNNFSMFAAIDGIEVLNTADYGINQDGDYYFEINNIDINDSNFHTLTLGLKAMKDIQSSLDIYTARIDFVAFDSHCDCGRYDYPAGDHDLDCYNDADIDKNFFVDILDVKEITDTWLLGPNDFNWNYAADIAEDGIINMDDYAVVTKWWDPNDPNDPNDGYYHPGTELYADFDLTGQIDMHDLGFMLGDWLDQGNTLRTDLYDDETIDFKDYAELINQWNKKSWLYDLK